MVRAGWQAGALAAQAGRPRQGRPGSQGAWQEGQLHASWRALPPSERSRGGPGGQRSRERKGESKRETVVDSKGKRLWGKTHGGFWETLSSKQHVSDAPFPSCYKTKGPSESYIGLPCLGNGICLSGIWLMRQWVRSSPKVRVRP